MSLNAEQMANLMEAEMATVFRALKGRDLPGVGREDRMVLFLAVARGLLKHLDANENAFRVTVTPSTGTATATMAIDVTMGGFG